MYGQDGIQPILLVREETAKLEILEFFGNRFGLGVDLI
jgi:hypothetical protein